MIRVLIADDSRATQRILSSLLSGEDGINVVGTASSGLEAVELYRKLQPDLVTMDIFMPEMDGLEATRKIMAEFPARIVIISSLVNSKDLKTSFEAMRAGAIDVIGKPTGVLRGDYTEVKNQLIRVIKRIMHAMPQNRFSWLPTNPYQKFETLRPITRDLPVISEPPAPLPPPIAEAPSAFLMREIPEVFFPSVICIGGSTGAPAVLVDILSSLPANYPVPIVVAQHIARGFAGGLADWLDSSCKLHAKLVEKGDCLKAGWILIARDDHHLRLRPKGVLDLVPSLRNEHYTPSINIFFESAAEAYGPRALGFILTGMGSDGANGLLKMRRAGAVTVAQDEASAVIYGMPRVATESGAAIKEMNPLQMITLLKKIGERGTGQLSF